MSGTRGASYMSEERGQSSSTSYEQIMGIPPGDAGGGATALSSRLATFRQWLANDANITVHPSICITNGEATDGTKNAPVLLFGPPPEVVRKNLAKYKGPAGTGRCGMVDKTADQALYDRTMGCQVRAAREIKRDEVVWTVPRTAMITPDLIATSDAGRAVLACCKPLPSAETMEFWDVFENTTVSEKKFSDNITTGTQMLVKILQERKKAEAAFNKATTELVEHERTDDKSATYELADPGVISTRAPVLAFLIQQRFSDELSPAVVSEGNGRLDDTSDGSALPIARRLDLPAETPATFAPYARTLPSSVAVPICWKRNELALLAGCILGRDALVEVTSRTALLAAEFIALVRAGLLQRFPRIFPPGMITWERWVWAAAVFDSRVLPVSCFLNNGEEKAVSHFNRDDSAIQSSPEVWDELGVMIPLQDMLNHEVEASQVAWEQYFTSEPLPETDGSPAENQADEDAKEVAYPPRAVLHKRVKKGNQIYATYGINGNQRFIVQYGFAQVGNTEDVKYGWALGDSVGNVVAPADYTPPAMDNADNTNGAFNQLSAGKDMVYDSMEAGPITQWWTEDRLSLLEKEARLTNQQVGVLKGGKKLAAVAYGDGRFYPIFLSAAVIGTMPPLDVRRCLKSLEGTGEQGKSGLALSKKHQGILRKYLQFFFCRKMEKCLQNLNNGLKDHFGVQLWTKVSEGGLHYHVEEGDGASFDGWQTFFDSNAYTTSMEMEDRYYAIGSDSCVLVLYDGFVRALQASIDVTMTQEKFEQGVFQQLKDLGFVLLDDDPEIEDEDDEVVPNGKGNASESEPADMQKEASTPSAGEQKDGQSQDRVKSGSRSSRRRNRKRSGGGGDRPPAIKLHIGNLAYTTSPAELFEYFASLCGRDNILECHIPTERDSGRSRGFGFVTLPEAVAIRVLRSGRNYEISGRLVKVAESNSTGGRSRGSGGSGSASSDRCPTCGYGPKYCACRGPDPRHGGPHPWHHHHGDGGRGFMVPPDPYYISRNRDDRRRRSYSRSPSYQRSRSRGGRNHERDYSRDYDHDYDREYYDREYRDHGSRSYSRGRDRGSERGRRDRDRSRERSRSRGRSRRSGSPGRPRSRDGMSSRGRSRSSDRSRSRSRSLSDERSSRRDRKGGDAEGRSPELGLASPNTPKGNAGDGGSDRKRDGTKRSRSRSRGRSGKRRKSSKKDGSRRHRSRSDSPLDTNG